MPIESSTRRHAAALAGVLACLALALVFYHALAGGTLLAPNPYDSYSLQAENWLAGRNFIADGESYPWLELAIYNGRYYQSFPPVPAAVMLPWVAVCGGWQAVPANLVIGLFGLLTAAGVYAGFWRRGAPPAACAFFSVFVGMGSNLFWLSTNGGVWFLAQVFGLCFAVWGMFFALGKTTGQNAAAALLFALAVGCRPFFAVLAACWALGLVRRTGGGGPQRAAALAVSLLPAAVIAGALAGYNWARFGSALEFGHNYLPEFVRAEEGQFSLSYLLPNLRNLLRPVTLDGTGQLSFPTFNGFLPFAANPLFTLWAAVPLGDLAARRQRPALARGAFSLPRTAALTAACCVGVLLLTCLHKTLGGWQFGARYTVDLLVWPLCWFLARREPYRPAAPALALCGAAVLFNLYGAVYMLSA